MIVRELDGDHDWTFGRGTANYLTESEAIQQCIKTKLLALKGNWFLNTSDGIAWFDYLEKNPNTVQLERDVKAEINSVDGVTSITSFDIQLDSVRREFLIQVTYLDKYNNTNEVEFNVNGN